nr:MAG TPA: hypothetical protein [Caudoviricetes sp.]
MPWRLFLLRIHSYCSTLWIVLISLSSRSAFTKIVFSHFT